MKFRWFGRTVTVDKYGIGVNGFKDEKILIGTFIRSHQIFTKWGLKQLFCYLFLRYDTLNKMFMSGAYHVHIMLTVEVERRVKRETFSQNCSFF